MMLRNTMLLPVLLGVAVIACLSGCAGSRMPAEPVTNASTASATTTTTATTTGPYRLRIGDEVAVSFLTDEELGFEGPVSPAGGLSVPLVGEIPAAGQTLADVAALLESRMAEYLVDARVAVTIKMIADQPVFVIGEVEHPGRIEGTGEMTVTRAIAAAGGLLSTAKTSSVMVIRTSGPNEPEAFRVDVADFLSGRDLTADMVLAPNDVVFVPMSVIGKIGEFVDLFFNDIAPAQLFYLRGWQMSHADESGWTNY